MPGYVQLGSNPVNIMVIHKGIKPQASIDAAVGIELPADRMGNLKIIVVIMAGIQTFVQLIIRHTVQFIRSDIAAVVSVNNLAHEPEIRFFFVYAPAHLLQE